MLEEFVKPKKIMPRRPAKWTREKIEQYLLDHQCLFVLVEQILPAQPSVMKMQWQCSTDLTHVWSATFDSIKTMNSGCPHCAGNIRMTLEQLNERVAKLNTGTVAISIEQSRRIRTCTKFAKFNCIKCNHIWDANIHNVLRYSYGCPICNANISVPNYDEEGNYFHSKLERYCWEKFKQQCPGLNIIRQYKYLPTRRLSADFYIPSSSTIVEVSGSLLLSHTKYSSTIEEKRAIAASQNKSFILLTNIAEINHYVKSLGEQINE